MSLRELSPFSVAQAGSWSTASRASSYPNCVVMPGANLEVYDWIQQLGYQVPGDLGLALISRFGKSDHVAGIDEQNDLLGVAAGKCLVSLLQHNERGLPEFPVYTMIEGRWVDRPTVRSAVVA